VDVVRGSLVTPAGLSKVVTMGLLRSMPRLLAAAATILGLAGCGATPSPGAGGGPVPVSGSAHPTASSTASSSGHLMYLGTGRRFTYAVDSGDGHIVWKHEFPGAVGNPPAVAGGLLYLAGATTLDAADAATGAPRWSVPIPGPYAGGYPVVTDGVVIVNRHDGSLVAVDAATGAPRWTKSPHQGMGVVGSYPIGDLLADNGVVYFRGGDGDDHVYALAAATGNPLWTVDQHCRGVLAPVSDGARIFLNCWIGNTGRLGVHALDARTGATLWTHEISGAPILDHGVVFAANHVLGATTDVGRVDAMDAATGAVRWSVSTPGIRTPDVGAAADGAVYIVDYVGDLAALDVTTGTTRWTIDGSNVSIVLRAGDGLAFACQDDFINAYDSRTGVKRWSAAYREA